MSCLPFHCSLVCSFQHRNNYNIKETTDSWVSWYHVIINYEEIMKDEGCFKMFLFFGSDDVF